MGLNGHPSIRDFSLTSCQKDSYLHMNIQNKKKLKSTVAKESCIIILNAIAMNVLY